MKENSKRWRKARRSWRRRSVNRILKSVNTDEVSVVLTLDSPGGKVLKYSELALREQNRFSMILATGQNLGALPSADPNEFAFTSAPPRFDVDE